MVPLGLRHIHDAGIGDVLLGVSMQSVYSHCLTLKQVSKIETLHICDETHERDNMRG